MPPDTGSDTQPRVERGQPVAFTGRIGRDPKVSTRDGKTTIKLAIAEHRQDNDGQEQTIWHEVWPSEKLAPKIAEQVEAGTLTQGIAVSIKGFRHERKPAGKQHQGKPFVRAFLINPVTGQSNRK